MMGAIKIFWKDYWDLCKQSGKLYKKHWKGYIVLIAMICGAEFGWIFRDKIKDKISDKLESKISKEEGVQ